MVKGTTSPKRRHFHKCSINVVKTSEHLKVVVLSQRHMCGGAEGLILVFSPEVLPACLLANLYQFNRSADRSCLHYSVRARVIAALKPLVSLGAGRSEAVVNAGLEIRPLREAIAKNALWSVNIR